MGKKRIEVGGVPVSDLIARFSSPLYILDAERIDTQATRLLEAFPPPRHALYYSLKANPSIAVMERLRARGFGCDACGVADLELAAMAGWPGDAISLTGVGLSTTELSLAVERGVWINVDSLTELRRYCAIAPGRSVGLRVNPEVVAGFHPHCQAGGAGGKLGISLDEIDKALAVAGSHGVSVGTLHAHIGSGISEKEPFLKTAQVLLELTRNIESVQSLNLGGGIGGRHRPGHPEFPLAAFAEELGGLLDDFEKQTGRTIAVALEPGDYLVREAGYLACTVRVTKSRTSDGRVARLAIVDASANLLPASLLYGTYYPLLVTASGDQRLETWDIFGRTNQGGERLVAGRQLPELCEGDLLVFGSAGAYAACRASQFNEIPRPAEVLVERGSATVVRRAESVEDLAHLQTGYVGLSAAVGSGFSGTPPRAQHLRVEQPTVSTCITVRYTVDEVQSRMTVDMTALGFELDAAERDALAAAWTVLLAQHVLAVEIDSEKPFSAPMARCLTPILQMLYDIRCSCDRRLPVNAPLLPTAATSTALPRRTAAADGILVLFSGGVDSTVLLRLLVDAGERVEALHLRVNSHVQLDEEVASRRIAERLGVPLNIVDVRLPGFERLGRRYSRSYGVYPSYNAVPHGRDLLLATIGAMVARHRGFKRLALGFDRNSFEKIGSYHGRTLYRTDVETEYGFELLRAFLRDCVSPEVELIAPLAGLPLYRIRRIAIEHFPELFAETQSCFWSRRCESCIKCISTYVMQMHLRREIQPFTRDLLDDAENEDLRTFVQSPTPAHELGYGSLVRYALSRLTDSVPGERRGHWLREFADKKIPHIRDDLEDAASRCLEVDFERIPAVLRPALQDLMHR